MQNQPALCSPVMGAKALQASSRSKPYKRPTRASTCPACPPLAPTHRKVQAPRRSVKVPVLLDLHVWEVWRRCEQRRPWTSQPNAALAALQPPIHLRSRTLQGIHQN